MDRVKERIDRDQHSILRDESLRLPIPIPPSIHGWMWGRELLYLYGLAKGLLEQGVPGDILEVGSYKGLSASALGQAGNLTCVDTFRGGEDLPETYTLPEFNSAMRRMGLTPRVVEGSSLEVLPRLVAEGLPYRLVFIDGSHVYENVKTDLQHAWELLSPSGALVADDYVGFSDVKRACDETGFGFVPVSPQFSKMAVAFKPHGSHP
jgi:hypothetical protein